MVKIAENTSDKSRPSRTISMTAGLTLTFGAIVMLAVFVVLYLALDAALKNTFALLGTQAQVISLYLEGEIKKTLLPSKSAVDEFARAVEDGRLDISNERDLRQYMMAAVTSTPHMSSLALVRNPNDGLVAVFDREGLRFLPISEIGGHSFREEMARDENKSAPTAGTYWGRIVRPYPDIVVLNVRRVVNNPAGKNVMLAAGIRVNELSRQLTAAGNFVNGKAFILYDLQYVLAHPNIAEGYVHKNSDHPLPRVSEFNDPVLKIFLDPNTRRERAQAFNDTTGIEIIFDEDGNDYPVITFEVDDIGDLPIRVGIHFGENAGDEVFGRLIAAAAAGLGVLIIALIIAYVVSRYLTAPISRLAIAADHVRHLRLDQIGRLKGSRVKEIGDATDAFDGMVLALKWFQTYVPQQLADRLISQRNLPESQSRNITVLFTDIVGFAARAERMTATQTATFLNAHFAILGKCIEAEGGIIDKYVGDAIMAFWGAPDEQPDHAARACRAALAMRQAIEQDNRRCAMDGESPVHIRIGIHTGDALVGNIGAPGRINYTVVGDSVNLASRLEAFGKRLVSENAAAEEAVMIMVSKTVLEHAQLSADAIEIGPSQVPGIQEPVQVWLL